MSSFFKPSSVFDNNPFVDGLLDFMVSSEGILFEQIREITWEMLEGALVDTDNRNLIWADSQALSIEQSVQRINETIEPGQGITVELIESEILGWMEMGEYQSEDISEAQMSKIEHEVMRWIKDHRRAQRRLSR